MKIPDEWLANIPDNDRPGIRAALQRLELAYSGTCPHCGSLSLAGQRWYKGNGDGR